jgi:hypothetical protein
VTDQLSSRADRLPGCLRFVARRCLTAAVCLLLVLSMSCALLKSTPEETPAEAPSAMIFARMAPGIRDRMMPPAILFQGADYLGRLVCPGGDQPEWKLTEHRGARETYQVQCPGQLARTLALDTAQAPPAAPPGFRLLDGRSYPEYRDGLAAGEKKDFAGMLAALNAALKVSPEEPVYRRERIYALYSLGRPLEALLEADDLLKTFPTVAVYRYRALTAHALGMKDVMLGSIDAIIRLTQPGNPQYAEAVCSKGALLDGEGNPQGVTLIQEGCALKYAPCCDALKSRTAAPPGTGK